ncbi:hypothetical protein [Saccharopolyspora elongata]|uniref:Uncharacterized protein n=1 Tax=Saccharopolyspora elongata TaxID=2530387 RepID=A0A4R4YEY4_9PSEU|nr:hypothetical protein [Saccharopolyspora elongata]TDD41792.1 hypothetical protein E1288_31260 [Saccharopolyspora elongata]
MHLVISLVGSLIFGGGAGALTAMLILKSGSSAQRPAPFPQQGFAPQPMQPPQQQFPPQQGFGQPPQGPYPPQ